MLHYTRQSEDQIRHTIAAIRESSLVCSPTAVSVAGISAADANYLAAAVAGRADYLVTGDGDLLALQDYQGTRIVSAVEFLVELQLRRRR